MKMELRIDPEFQDQIPPLTEEEFRQLEANILEDGVVLNALIVWDGVIVDGHNRYRIIQRHPELEYHVYSKDFPDRYAAIAWICKNQLGRRNLTPEQKKYLIGKQYEAEKARHGGERNNSGCHDRDGRFTASGQNDHLRRTDRTRERIAAANHTSDSYVRRAEVFAKGVDAADEALPGIRQEILSGSIKPAANAVAAVAKAQPEERRQMAEELRKTKAKEEKRKPRRSVKSETQEIEEISDRLLMGEHVANEEDMLGELESAVSSMIQRCDICFAQFPALLKKAKYRSKVIQILEESRKYIQRIKGEAAR